MTDQVEATARELLDSLRPERFDTMLDVEIEALHERVSAWITAALARVGEPTVGATADEMEICRACNGSGFGVADTTCFTCNGSGGVPPDGQLDLRRVTEELEATDGWLWEHRRLLTAALARAGGSEVRRDALEKCRERFAEYAENHQDKANEAGLTGGHAEFMSRCAKVARNQEMVDLIDRALSGQEEAGR